MRSQRLDVNVALKPSSAASKSTIRQVDVVEAIRQSDGNIAVKRLHVSDVIERDGTTRYRDASGQILDLAWITKSI